jgi:hypothetical protein
MNSQARLCIKTGIICALILALLACCARTTKKPISSSSSLDIARVQAEFQAQFALGENTKIRPSLVDLEILIEPYKEVIKRFPGFVGFAFGIRIQPGLAKPTMDYAFKIYIDPKSKEKHGKLADNLPKRIGPYDVVFVEVGLQPAWAGCVNSDYSLRGVLAPGTNVGIPRAQNGMIGTCGTLGMFVWKKGQDPVTADTERYFLSAWHVLTQNGTVRIPVDISQPGNSFGKVNIIGRTDAICSPECSKRRYEVGLVRINSSRQIETGYVAQRDPYVPGLNMPPDLYYACGISKHIMGGTQSLGGCVLGYYRDFAWQVNVNLGSISVTMLNQMVFTALSARDIIAGEGDSGMVWTDSEGWPVAITMAVGTYGEYLNYYAPYNAAVGASLKEVFNDLQITGFKPTPDVVVYPKCIIARALDNPHERAMLETEIAPALHNSSLEPLYRELRVGGKYHHELYELTFSDPELAKLAKEASNKLLNVYGKLMRPGGLDDPAIDKQTVEAFSNYVKKVSYKMSQEAREYLFKLLNHVQEISTLNREDLVQKFKIDTGQNISRIPESLESIRVESKESKIEGM